MEVANIKFTCHLTKNHQLKAADELIKKLKLKLGAANAYIQELEEEREPKYLQLKKENAELKCKNNELNMSNKKLIKISEKYKNVVDSLTAKYSEDLTVLKEEPAIQSILEKHKLEIEKLQSQLATALRQRDLAFIELSKLNNGQKSN